MNLDIAVLEDCQEDIFRLQDLIFNMEGNWHIDQYTEGQKLLHAIQEGKHYDLLFCDIYLKEENGMETAEMLKDAAPDTALVFMTVSQDHAVDAFSMNALHYLVKPVQQQDILEVFRRLTIRQEPRNILAIQIDRSLRVLFQDEIMCVESHGHSTIITCINNATYSIWKPYREIDALLDNSFTRVKKGVTLNMRWIVRMSYRDCVTRDGRSWLLRRDQAREIREKYFNFIEEELQKK